VVLMDTIAALAWLTVEVGILLYLIYLWIWG
jgi:hypothetical protein